MGRDHFQNIIPEHLEEVLQSEKRLIFLLFRRGWAFPHNCFQQRDLRSGHAVCDDIPEFEELGLIPVLKTIMAPRGIVLVSGTTGSGKSTTLAAMLQHINKSSRKHIVTQESHRICFF